MSANGSAPTRVRFAVVAVTALISVLLYLHRICFGFIELNVREDLRLSNEQMSWVLGAFFFSYALAQVPTGWLSDRFGARRMLTLYIIAWSLFTAATGLATGLLTLLAFRLACGIAQAGAYPTAAGLVRRWVPLSSRGKASSIVALGGRVGGATASLLTAALLVLFTPLSTSSLLEDRDILDLRKLCEQMRLRGDGPAEQLGERILQRLPESTREAVAQVVVQEEPDPLLKTEVVHGLNQVLKDPDLTDDLDLSGLKLPQEARRLLEASPAARSPAETERLNRLVLEVAFPGTLRQVYGKSWRDVLLLYGGVGLLAALGFWLIVRDRPALHPWANAAEARLVGDDLPATAPRPVGGIPWMLLLRSRNMWLSSLCQFGVNIGWVFLITLLPRYLAEVYRVPIEERATMVMLPLLVSCAGMFLGGWLTDQLTASFGLRWGRALPIGLAAFVCAVMYLSCPWFTTPWAVVIALTIMAVSVDMGVPSLWALAQDIGGRNVGATLGWGNMWGNFGAALSPVLLTQVQLRAGWTAVFVTCAVAFLVASAAGLGLDARRPIDPSEASPAPPSPAAAD